MVSLKTKRSLLAKFRRAYKHEFWSYKTLYLPVFGYILYRCLKAGDITLFASVNPGMPASGIKNESKTDIYRKFSPELIIPFRYLKSADGITENTALIKAFMNEHNLGFPIILKPDKGERGDNVKIVAKESELAAYLAMPEVTEWIVQKYIAGREYGVFYMRYPSQPKGFLFSVSEKEMLWVTGDGRHTLEELILLDDRAMLLADIHLRNWAHMAGHVLEAGERFQIVRIGAHSKGSIFVDRSEIITEAMTDAFDRISKTYNGFYFGRFDVRVPSEEDLQAGKSIHIMELNGLTGEPANMYTPHYSLLKTYRILFACWRHALNIAEENHKKQDTPKYTLRQIADMIR